MGRMHPCKPAGDDAAGRLAIDALDGCRGVLPFVFRPCPGRHHRWCPSHSPPLEIRWVKAVSNRPMFVMRPVSTVQSTTASYASGPFLSRWPFCGVGCQPMDRTVPDGLSLCQGALFYPVGIGRAKSGQIGEQIGPAGKPLDPHTPRISPKGSREGTSLSRVNHCAMLRTVISRLGHSPLQGFAGKNLGHQTARGQLRCKSTERGAQDPKGSPPKNRKSLSQNRIGHQNPEGFSPSQARPPENPHSGPCPIGADRQQTGRPGPVPDRPIPAFGSTHTCTHHAATRMVEPERADFISV